MRTRRLLAAATAAALLFTAASCGSEDEPKADPTPAEEPTTQDPTPATPAWEDEYTDEQIEQYEAALARWDEYERRAEPIWAEGKVTPAAERLFKEYWLTWPNTLNTLHYLEEQGITRTGRPEVIWSKPNEIIDRGNATTVVIRRCIDDSNVKVESRAGTPEEPEESGPSLGEITMDKVGDNPWRITSADAVEDEGDSCDS
jgi:hypothetical protein